MAKFLINANYTHSGIQGLLTEGGTRRKAALAASVESVGGNLESMYYALGTTDAVLIADLPDVESAVALSMRIRAAGALDVSLTQLVEPAAIDVAAQKEVSYRRPGA